MQDLKAICIRIIQACHHYLLLRAPYISKCKVIYSGVSSTGPVICWFRSVRRTYTTVSGKIIDKKTVIGNNFVLRQEHKEAN